MRKLLQRLYKWIEGSNKEHRNRINAINDDLNKINSDLDDILRRLRER